MGDERDVAQPVSAGPTIDIAEAAGILKCTPETVEDMLRACKIRGIKAGRSWVIPRATFVADLSVLATEQTAQRLEQKRRYLHGLQHQTVADPQRRGRRRRPPVDIPE